MSRQPCKNLLHLNQDWIKFGAVAAKKTAMGRRNLISLADNRHAIATGGLFMSGFRYGGAAANKIPVRGISRANTSDWFLTLPPPAGHRKSTVGFKRPTLEAFMTKSPIEKYHEIREELDLALLSIGKNALGVELTDMERVRVLMEKLQRCVIAARRHDYRAFCRQVKMRRAA